MTETKTLEENLRQLLELQLADIVILQDEESSRACRMELDALDEGVTILEEKLEKVTTRVQDGRLDVRSGERVADEKRDTLSRTRNRVSNVQNERQYSAASLEFDLVVRDLRALEDKILEKMQRVEDMENERKELDAKLQKARERAGPERDEIAATASELEEKLAIQRDRRDNIAQRIDKRSLALYDRIRSGLADVGLATVTDEGVCGNCHTFVTVQQRMEVKNMDRLICCEGCGVILYPEEIAL